MATYYVAYYGKIPVKGTLDDARKVAYKLLNDENYGEMEVPIYRTKSAKYGEFIGIVWYTNNGGAYARGLSWATPIRGTGLMKEHPMKRNGTLR